MAKSMIVKAFVGLSGSLSNLTMNDVYKPYVNVGSVEFYDQEPELIYLLGFQITHTIQFNHDSDCRVPIVPDGCISKYH